ncbi:MAG TPA: AMP-binding protein [Bdellovibrionales bacterium]|nr:AMP-binding protein [Bdellovibrionales bacterium]
MRSYTNTTRPGHSAASSSKLEAKCLADLFLRYVADRADRTALSIPRKRENGKWTDDQISFRELNDLVFSYQHALLAQGLKAGDRILVLAPVRAELYALFYAMCSAGIVPVFIDTNVGARAFLKLVRAADICAIISTPGFHRLRWLAPTLLKYKRFTLAESGKGFTNLMDWFPERAGAVATIACEPNNPVLITYTTGSSGQPKGADRSHSVLYNQYRISRAHWPEELREIDMPWFPMVAFQNLNCGISTVLPAVNFRRIDEFEPRVIAAQIQAAGVTRMSAPPSVYAKLCRYLIENRVSLPSVRRLIAGGAPVSQKVAALMRVAFPGAEAHIVYGSTEAEPISFVSIDEMLKEPADAYLVGKPIPEIQIRICRLTNDELSRVSSEGVEPFVTSGVGEVLLAGPHVVKRYFDNEDANRVTKLHDPSGKVWHRTGDLGFFDHLGRLWLAGRLHDGICYPIEHRAELISGVDRAALTARALKIRLEPGANWPLVKSRCEKLFEELGVEAKPVEAAGELPLDRRHRWKIERNKL